MISHLSLHRLYATIVRLCPEQLCSTNYTALRQTTDIRLLLKLLANRLGPADSLLLGGLVRLSIVELLDVKETIRFILVSLDDLKQEIKIFDANDDDDEI